MADEEHIVLTRAELDRVIGEAADKAVEHAKENITLRVLKELGLDDKEAIPDIRELRSLLKTWRDMRKSALQAIVKLLTTALLGALLLGMGIKLGASSLLK